MSKQRNTLFNYFTSPAGSAKNTPAPRPSPVAAKTPSSSAKTNRASSKTPTSRPKTKENKSFIIEKTASVSDDPDKENEGSDGDEQSPAPPKKRRRILVLDSEDSGDEYKPGKADNASESESESSGVESDLSDNEESNSGSDGETPKKKSKKNPQNSSVKKNGTGNSVQSRVASTPPSTVSASTKAKLAQFSASQPIGEATSESWSHLKYEFIKPDKVRDAMKRKPSDPQYDTKTLFVPDDFKQSCTPAMRQWWEMKSRHYDCVLFFKVGKFYELYHMDAVIGVNELDLTFMKGDLAHSGFPEIAYGRFSSCLVRKGFKVARVEQTETPDMMAERCKGQKKVTKFDKVVKREICQITTKGTQTFSVIDGAADDTETNYLLALTEKTCDSSVVYGVCFIDTSIGVFHLGQFADDRHSSCLRTMIAHHPPVQILYEKNAISAYTLKLLNSSCGTVLKDALNSNSEFWNSEKTLKNLAEGAYFKGGPSDSRCPEGFKQFLADGDSLCLTANDESELAVSALGACVWYLRDCKLDQQLVSMGRFVVYRPIRWQDAAAPEASDIVGKHMVLDSITLNNLDILYYGNEGKEGTLLNKLDMTSTPFGKRLLRHWVCSPLCEIASITARQEAVKDLLQNPHLIQDARELMKKLPDLERLLSKIHAQGNAARSETHPDSRAIFYEDRVYSKRKITDFSSTLAGFKTAQKIAQLFQAEESNLESKLLKQCMCIAGESTSGKFPEISESLEFFETAFDHAEAQKEGRIIPKPGVDSDYDGVMRELEDVKQRLDDYLELQKKFFGCKVVYVGTAKNRFQLEIADGPSKKATFKYELQGQRKGYKRFWTDECRELLGEQIAAEDQKTNILNDLSRKIFYQFSSKYDEWNTVINCLSALDVLMSMAEYARNEEGETCVPEFVPSKDKPFVSLRDGRHPCISAADGFVPNDTTIGCDGTDASLLLLTGPNMGGKSTLMRQLGLIVIMAHMGCHVPAAGCRLSPVDRVFTRLGANDDIMAGESTFFVELSETSSILRHATRHSLVLVDELGRGTSTYDGTAIAAGVVHQLMVTGCRTVFSTHYHTLVEDFKHSPEVTLGHMACMVENDNEEDPSEETVTFLYKLTNGACPKSYGFNAARLAGIPLHIIKRGHDKAVELEKEISRRKLFQAFFDKGDGVDLPTLLSQTLVLV